MKQRTSDLPALRRAIEAERRLIAMNKEMSELRDENAILRAATASAYQPGVAPADFGEDYWNAMNDTRLMLAGVGHVRPRQLASGRWSATEFEVILTVDEAEAFLMMLGRRKLSVPSETMKA